MQVMGTPGFRSERPFISRKAAVATKRSGRDARLQARRQRTERKSLDQLLQDAFHQRSSCKENRKKKTPAIAQKKNILFVTVSRPALLRFHFLTSENIPYKM
ncbi:hypothetical protein CDAR_544291 [Caerostris darwini]|uniref:Uncharacterized protein n=1 Tax=Caerostris darwini TaxID=1538125 RepID=A0AAV4R7J7_9ARAC|nr:hypothetical protein CDAR_544291 [Caerostris darwini]